MDHHEQMAALRARLAGAEAERDAWRTSGLQENYLEAYSRVEALALQVDNLHRAGLRSLERSSAPRITEPDAKE